MRAVFERILKTFPIVHPLGGQTGNGSEFRGTFEELL